MGHRLQRALTGGPNRRFPSLHSPPGGSASPSIFLNRRLSFPILALLAALAFSLLFLMPGGPLQAQEAAIKYAENDTGPVVTFTAVDPEGESIVWSPAGVDMDDFTIEGGVLRFKSSPDFENPADDGTNNVYEVTVQASDGGADTTAMEEVTIEVTNVEEPGTVTLSTLQPQVGVAITATLTDPDNVTANSESWQWYRGNSEIVGATVVSYTPTAGDVGSTLRATAMYDDTEADDKTAQEDSAHAVRAAPDSNIPPTFPTPSGQTDTDQTREVAENTPAGTDLGDPVAASDPDVLTYSLGGDDAASFSIDRATGQLSTKAALNFEAAANQDANNVYAVIVTATDPFGAMATANVNITVTDVNEAPSVTGDDSIDHAENGTAVQVGDSDAVYTASDVDADDDANNLTWTLSGADASKFSIGDTDDTRTLSFNDAPNFESPGDSNGDNVYEVTLVVTDSKSNTGEQAVTVKVTNMEEMGAITLSTLQPRIGFSVAATLADPDNVNADSVSWQWYRGATISITERNFATFDPAGLPANECDDTNTTDCAIKGATSAVYVPVAGDARTRNSLTAVATYSDGHGDGKDYAATASANDVLANTINNPPVFPDRDAETEGRQTAQERMIAENTTAGENIGDRVVATDEDANLTYSLGGPDAASFDIDRGETLATAGQLKTKAALNKEAKDTYTVTVTAADSLGASSTITVTITVTNVDEMPDLEGEAPDGYAEKGTGAVATFTAVDPEGESIVWTLDGADAAAFSIVNGVLRFESPPDFEAQASASSNNAFEVTIQASDGGQNTTAEKPVIIEVTNVEEAGAVMLSTLQPQVDVPITATLSDPDNVTPSTVTWQWYRGSSPIIGATDGAGTITSSYTPTAGVGSALRAKAMYDDDEGEDKTAEEVSYRSVRSAPQSNTDPKFPDQDPAAENIQTAQTRKVAENTPAGRNLGAPVEASDPGDVLTYSLDSGNDAASFNINRVTGQLSTKSALDFEESNNVDHGFTVTVTATDPIGAPATSQVTITVTDVNEDPSVTGTASIDHEEGTTILDVDASDNLLNAATYTGSDPDAADPDADLKWSLSGADASKFNITDSGAVRTLSFKDAPDYESPGDSGGNNVYEVTVMVTDSKSNSDEQAVTVKVTNMGEAGVVELSTLQPRINFAITATLTDADNIAAGSVSWQWYKGTVASDNIPDTECVDATPNDCFIKGATSATYTPVTNDVGDTLVAVALYTDGSPNDGDAKDFAMMATANQVLADTRNKAPVFPDRDAEMDGEQTDQVRMVQENAPMIGSDPAITGVRNVGAVVTAMDFITANDGMMIPEILTYSLGGPDADSFSINRGTAQISTKADVPLDKEEKDTYTVTVTATDPSGLEATITVTIMVTNVDEAPEIVVGGLVISGKASIDYAENGTGTVATYTAAGPDAASATWSLSGDDAGDFTITGGVLAFRSAPDHENPADADEDNVYQVTVEADDGTYMDTQDVTVTVTNVDELGTVSGEATVDYAENGTHAVATYTADGPASATWSLSGDDAEDFAISTGGELTFAASPNYEAAADADTDNVYQVTVRANAGGEMGEVAVTVTVTNVGELGMVSGDDTVDYPENGTDAVATYTADGPDAASATWSLSGDDAGDFTITGGVLAFRSAPDHESPADADGDNVYEVTVQANAGGEMDEVAVTVTVTDVGELGMVSGVTTADYAENGTDAVATYTADGPDAASATWSLSGDDAGDFTITGGVLAFRSAPDHESPADADGDNVYERPPSTASDGG